MTREEIDRLWQQALTAATRGGELYARYHFADMLTTVVATDAALKEPEQKPATMPTQYGWLCPACGRGNAPLAQTCPCKGWPTMQITCGPATMTGGA